MAKGALLDVDGTLMDSNYHHALAWSRAFRESSLTVPVWRIHRSIGMGGDQLVAAVADAATERSIGDKVRDAHDRHFERLIDEVVPLPGAHELIAELREHGATVVLASSAQADEVERYIGLLEAQDMVDAKVTAEDVERTKPEPDLIAVALERAGLDSGVLVGDSIWDVEAGKRAGLDVVAILTGGFSSAELRDAGASSVFTSLDELRASIDESALAAVFGR